MATYVAYVFVRRFCSITLEESGGGVKNEDREGVERGWNMNKKRARVRQRRRYAALLENEENEYNEKVRRSKNVLNFRWNISIECCSLLSIQTSVLLVSSQIKSNKCYPHFTFDTAKRFRHALLSSNKTDEISSSITHI